MDESGGTKTHDAWQAPALELAKALRQLRSELVTLPDEDDDVVARRAIWAAVGGAGVAKQGIERSASALSGMAEVLEAFQQRLSRLLDELVCLDDGDAAELFG